MTTPNNENRITLLVKPNQTIVYDRASNQIVSGTNVKTIGSIRGSLLSQLADHPGIVQTSQDIMEAINPGTRLLNQPKEKVAQLLHPHISRLRRGLKDVDKQLDGVIITILGTGFVYEPHESTGIKPKTRVTII